MNKLKEGQWSNKYENCIDCHSTSHKHYGQGRCKLCYERARYNDPKNNARLRLKIRKNRLIRVIINPQTLEKEAAKMRRWTKTEKGRCFYRKRNTSERHLQWRRVNRVLARVQNGSITTPHQIKLLQEALA